MVEPIYGALFLSTAALCRNSVAGDFSVKYEYIRITVSGSGQLYSRFIFISFSFSIFNYWKLQPRLEKWVQF